MAACRAGWADSTVAAVVLTGAGDRAFCAGGDQKQRAETGDYGPTESGLFEIERLHRLIRAIPKPAIAAVNGFGSAYLARVVGEKRAREIWFLLDQYDAATAERWGLVNAVVPQDQVVPTAVAWGKKIAAYSPTAMRFLKHSFNADTDHIVGIQNLVFDGLSLYTKTDEGREGFAAYNEKRPPDFTRFR